ncbi:MAG: hypothetical protein IJW63_04710 [Lachnospiraceae bacterium]|nr:hypothetical protein [Lachnospiraceae bacterium]
MLLYILASLIILCMLIAYENKKHEKQEKDKIAAFWERERMANHVRRKPLDDLDYISIPFDSLPFDVLKEDEKVAECHQQLRTLSELKIVNFTGISNTDLKLQYGTANITLLSEYDQNFTVLARTLQTWAKLLYEHGFETETRQILEYAISIKTDVSKSYYLLAHIYERQGEVSKIKNLIQVAENLNSVLSTTIVRTLQEPGPYID